MTYEDFVNCRASLGTASDKVGDQGSHLKL